jgi:hypothetical protein
LSKEKAKDYLALPKNNRKETRKIRNSYSDLFDILMFGPILLVEDEMILTIEEVKEMWRYRIF